MERAKERKRAKNQLVTPQQQKKDDTSRRAVRREEPSGKSTCTFTLHKWTLTPIHSTPRTGDVNPLGTMTLGRLTAAPFSEKMVQRKSTANCGANMRAMQTSVTHAWAVLTK